MERLEELPAGTLHLDTVRSLHQTVVSLRTALELSKNELKQLKEKYQQHTQCTELTDVIEKLTIENHILRRKIIETDYNEPNKTGPNLKLQVSYTPRSQDNSQRTDFSSEVIIKTATPDLSENISRELQSVLENHEEQESLLQSQSLKSATPEVPVEVYSQEQRYDLDESEIQNQEYFCSENLDTVIEDNQVVEFNTDNLDASDNINTTERDVIDEFEPNLEYELSQQDKSHVNDSYNHEFKSFESKFSHENSFKTKLELSSKFDVRIKVRTLREGTITSSNTSDTDSTLEDKKERRFEHKKDKFQSTENIDKKEEFKTESSENIDMAVPNETDCKSKTDKFDIKVRITSEENLLINEKFEVTQTKDNLNLEVDDLSLSQIPRSVSEGDNSVFSESMVPMARNPGPCNQEPEGSDNESEEVDDIELIFTTDESKDMSQLQEDLVSIQESDQWPQSPTSTTHSTPVLIKFHTLDPELQPSNDNQKHENQENTQSRLPTDSLKIKRVSLPTEKDINKDVKHVMFSAKSLDLPGRGILKRMDNKSEGLFKRCQNSSAKRLDSMDSLSCDYRGMSFDNTKSSSFEMGSSMDMLQRDGSTEAFRNRYLGHRFSLFAETDISKCGISEDDLSSQLNFRRNTCPNPFQNRPISLRPRGSVRTSLSPSRRESGAQTDLSALPNRWTSDSYLAHKLPSPGVAHRPARRLTVDTRSPLRPDRNEMARRQLLSDLGFTSMVPELSRSAEPVWARGHPPLSPALSTNNTSKLFSRGSSYQSTSLSVDRSNDWIPQNIYVPPPRDIMTPSSYTIWRSSLPDVRREYDYVAPERNIYLRRSIDDLREEYACVGYETAGLVSPYIPSEPRQLRLGHTVKVITPQGRIAVGRVRYVGIAGGSSDSGTMVGAVFSLTTYPTLPANDGTCNNRRYFTTPPHHTALFVPFSKVVMAWAHHEP